MDNLAIVTGEENRGQIQRTKRMGEDNPRSVLTEENVREIRRLRAEGVTARALAARFNVTEKTIYMVAKRRRWPHVD